MAVVLAIGLSIPTTLLYTAKASAADGTENKIYEEVTRDNGKAEVSKLTAASAGWVLDDEVNYFKSAGDASIYTAYSEDLGSAHLYTSSYDEWSSLDPGWDRPVHILCNIRP